MVEVSDDVNYSSRGYLPNGLFVRLVGVVPFVLVGLSVCLSIQLSQTSVPSKCLNIASRKECHMIALGL